MGTQFTTYKPSVSSVLQKDGRAVVMAMDHARMNGVFRCLEDPVPAMMAAIEGGADAIMTSYGVCKHYANLLDGKIAKILRLDTGSTRFHDGWEEFEEWYQVFTVEDAARVGAVGVISYGFPGLDVDASCLKIMGRVSAEADKYGMCSIAEMHACPSPKVANPYDPEIVASESRIAAEFGTDIVKTDYTGDPESFKYVVDCCPVPIICAGGSKCDTPKDTLIMMDGILKAGGAGCIFGRQIWQDECPVGMVRALVAQVHGNATVEEAYEIYRENLGR